MNRGQSGAMFGNSGRGLLKGDMMTLLYRVVFCGDHVESVREMAVLMGQRVVMEG